MASSPFINPELTALREMLPDLAAVRMDGEGVTYFPDSDCRG